MIFALLLVHYANVFASGSSFGVSRLSTLAMTYVCMVFKPSNQHNPYIVATVIHVVSWIAQFGM